MINLTQLPLLSPGKLTGVILHSFTSLCDGDGDVLHGVTGVRVQVTGYVYIAHHRQLRVGLYVVVDIYLLSEC